MPITLLLNRAALKYERQSSILKPHSESRHFAPFSSDVAIEEASRGNADAAQRRVGVLREVTILTLNDDAVELALAFVAGRAIPAEAKVVSMAVQ